MASNAGVTFAFIVSLIGGLIILVASSLNAVWYSYGASNFGGYGSYVGGMMDDFHNFMGAYGSSNEFLAGISLLAAVCGVVVVMSSIFLRLNPSQQLIWASVIIVFSAVSFVGMGGFFIGAVMGIIGGIFVLAVRPTPA